MLSLLSYRQLEKKLWLAVDKFEEYGIDPPAAGGQEPNLALVLFCKNVAADIDEWIRFHELAGVRHFYLYDNGSTDGTAARARRHDGAEAAVRVFPWKMRGAAGGRLAGDQELAYVHAILNYGPRHRWMAFIDADEFIFPRRHDSIGAALEQLASFSCIALPWNQFGHCGHETRPAEPCVFAYRLRHQQSRYAHEHFKCIVDPCQIHTASIHHFHTRGMGETVANDQGRVEPSFRKRHVPEFRSREHLQLNHYRTKSIAENLAKSKAIRHGDSPQFRGPKVISQIDILSRDTVEDDAAIEFLQRRGLGSCADYQAYVEARS
ncbi:MAG: glycosyltransferase family 92 protein [Betaproteobacteria bacterium AqS2]|uniref:Glycosyltransferase family 92 protein n=1 Tax=Candidatus Amphirhobacter heronislandensis TaxID=1732024 RepID=A0A930UCC7_9GAMM|nr:glycosyltransferase family 92 protein [Betaproteobacteria bacterium AqS2]